MLEDLDMIESDPGHCRARAYDMVMNGCEVGGGSIRINTMELQERMLVALGFTPESAEERFGFLLEAFRYGAPPMAAWPLAWIVSSCCCWARNPSRMSSHSPRCRMPAS